jgi:hypothetical protein
MSTATICDGCGEPIEAGTPFTAVYVFDVTFDENGTRVNGVSAEYDFHTEHAPSVAGSDAGTT